MSNEARIKEATEDFRIETTRRGKKVFYSQPEKNMIMNICGAFYVYIKDWRITFHIYTAAYKQGQGLKRDYKTKYRSSLSLKF